MAHCSTQLLIAEAWPDGTDVVAMVGFFVIALGLPAWGYFFMARDFRRWLRSLRRALISVVRRRPETPYWLLLDQPPCLTALELTLPCTQEQVLDAYRAKVKQLHPDRGGDLQEFLNLQKHFEQAVFLVRQQEAEQAS